jgi:hypothetical protein
LEQAAVGVAIKYFAGGPLLPNTSKVSIHQFCKKITNFDSSKIVQQSTCKPLQVNNKTGYEKATHKILVT